MFQADRDLVLIEAFLGFENQALGPGPCALKWRTASGLKMLSSVAGEVSLRLSFNACA